MNKENGVKKVWVKGFIDKKGDIIIPINSDGAIHIIKGTYKNEVVWKWSECGSDGE